MTQKRPLKVAIIGAGMSGLCMAAKLQDAGIDSFTIFEKADDVGGTWRDNTYPGLTCDVPSRYYSYSFRPNPNWSHLAAAGSRDTGVFPARWPTNGAFVRHIRFGADVTTARYDDGKWRLTTGDGEETFDVLVTATGVLRVPRYPDIPGTGHVRRTRVPFLALGPLGLLAGQADRFDRDRLDRRADHRGARRQGAPVEGLSAHRPVDLPIA